MISSFIITPHSLFNAIRGTILTLVFYLLLLFSYINFIEPNFGYLGFERYNYYTANIYYFAVIPIVMQLLLPKKFDRPSDLVAWILFILVYCPLILLLSCTNTEIEGMYSFLASVSLGLVFISLSGRVDLKLSSQIRMSSRQFYGAMLLIFLISNLLMLIQFGIRPPPNLFDVYDTRLEAREILSAGLPGIGYIVRWNSSIINPILITIGLFRRKPIILLAGLLGQYLIFTYDGTKTTILSPLFILGFYVLYRINALSPNGLVAIFSSTILFSCALDYILNTPILSQLFVRRIIMVPGLLSTIYLEYFQNNYPFMWSHSILRGITQNYYPEYSGPGFLIGYEIFRNPDGNANANLFADGFANLKYTGIIIASLLLSLFLSIFNSLSSGKPKIFAMSLLIMPSIALSNTGITQSFTTHGLLLALILVTIMPDTHKEG